MKIKLSFIWIPYICIWQYLALRKVVTFIFLILALHELSHMLMAWFFRYKITGVTIYPFGLAAHIPDMGKGNIIQEMLILSAGPLSQLLIPAICRMFVSWGWISIPFFDYIITINTSIMIFNLLPIYPLDGGRMLQGFIHCILRYQRGNVVTYVCSGITLFILCYIKFFKGITAFLLLVFMTWQLIEASRRLSFTTLQFYYYRWKHPVSYKPILNSQKDLYRARYNIMQTTNGWLHEQAWLQRLFDKRNKKDKQKT